MVLISSELERGDRSILHKGRGEKKQEKQETKELAHALNQLSEALDRHGDALRDLGESLDYHGDAVVEAASELEGDDSEW